MDSQTNKYLCPLPFGAVQFDMNDKMGPCSLNNISTITTIEDYLTNTQVMQLKEDMKNGVRNPICNACYNLEDHNLGTNRQFWFHNITQDVYNLNKIVHVELRFSNICNFKCRTCIPNTSSAIANEEKKYLNWSQPILNFSGPDESFVLTEVKKIVRNLSTIGFSGGEPMLQWQHWDLLDYLIENKLNPKLVYFTNGSVLKFKNQHIFDKWKHFDNVTCKVSIDAVGESAEYWRHGDTLDHIISNIKEIKKEMPNVTVEYMLTVSWPNIFHIDRISDELLKFDEAPHISINPVFSDVFNLRVLPAEMKKIVEEYLLNFECTAELKRHLLGLISFMNGKDESNLLPIAIAKLKEIDIRRGESFIDAFPEFKEMVTEHGY